MHSYGTCAFRCDSSSMQEAKLRSELKIKLEMAKFLQQVICDNVCNACLTVDM